MLTIEQQKAVVRRLIEEVMNNGRLDIIDEIYTPAHAKRAHEWIEPFLASFSDVQMQIVDLIAEHDKVVGRFRCSGTHTGEWLGLPPTGRRFERVEEVYFFRIREGRIASVWGLEDASERLRQLGLSAGISIGPGAAIRGPNGAQSDAIGGQLR